MDTNSPSIPPELISQILRYVSSKSTLRNVALCSRQWYDIAIPHLYGSIDATGIQARDETSADVGRILRFLEQRVRVSSFKRSWSLESYVKHFLRNPNLAAHVRHLSVSTTYDLAEPLSTSEMGIGLEMALRNARKRRVGISIQQAIQRAAHSENEHAQWLEQAQRDNSLLALLLLSNFTKLETLELSTTMEEEAMEDTLERTLKRAARQERPFDSAPTLQRLHSIVWAHDLAESGGRLTTACFLFQSVRAVYFHRIASEDEASLQEGLTRVEPRSSNCTHLELKDCRFNRSDLTALVSIPRGLKTFIYEVAHGHISYCDIHFSDIRNVLDIHKETLEDLWLGYGHDGVRWIDGVDDASPMTSLRGFHKLRRIRIAPDFIFGGYEVDSDIQRRPDMLVEFLPPNIESLVIMHADEFCRLDDDTERTDFSQFYMAVQKVLLRKDSHFPCLQTLSLETSLPQMIADRESLEQLSEIASRGSVKMVLRNNHGDRRYKGYDSRVERKWGMDEDIEWMECESGCNQAPLYELVDLSKL